MNVSNKVPLLFFHQVRRTPIHCLMKNSNLKVDAEFLKAIDVLAPGALAAVDEYA